MTPLASVSLSARVGGVEAAHEADPCTTATMAEPVRTVDKRRT